MRPAEISRPAAFISKLDVNQLRSGRAVRSGGIAAVEPAEPAVAPVVLGGFVVFGGDVVLD
ncbi:MAG TPA: hypothetical protein VFI56_08660 [Vicinamibacterales bacterium]|nr:hypothetical protein [Vicinamibacterales bacterium]